MSLNPPLRDWRGRTAWVLGASSGIGRATASLLHARGAHVVVSARSGAALSTFSAEHPGSLALSLDATDRTAVHAAVQQIVAAHGRIDLALYCAGTYTPMRATAFDLDTALQHLQVNQAGALLWLDAVLPQLLRQAVVGGPAGGGHLSLVSSVAGYTGLPQSLAYGPTKAALINLTETLYQDLHPQGLGVSLINPGFVRTPLTAHNAFPMPALISPEQAAAEILRGWEQGRFEIHFPRRFTRMVKLLRLLPYAALFPALRRVTGA